MKFSLPIIVLTAASFCLTGCNHEKPYKIDDPSLLLPDDPDNPAPPPYSFAQELDNPDTRYVSASLDMAYSRGGILVSTLPGRIVMTDLATGNRIEFSGATNKTGNITNPELFVNGCRLTIEQATVERADKKGTWIHIQAPDNEHIVIVVSDL